MKINSLAVFCGSQKGKDPTYIEHALTLGKIIAEKNITLIYGGGSTGMMGAIADAVMGNGGTAIGIIPKRLDDKEHSHKGITELVVVEDMHTRKKRMYDLCDAAIILPGGFGTLDELFEMLTWNQLAIHNKRIFILNSGNFYEHLLQHMLLMEKQGFLYEKLTERVTVINSPTELQIAF